MSKSCPNGSKQTLFEPFWYLFSVNTSVCYCLWHQHVKVILFQINKINKKELQPTNRPWEFKMQTPIYQWVLGVYVVIREGLLFRYCNCKPKPCMISQRDRTSHIIIFLHLNIYTTTSPRTRQSPYFLRPFCSSPLRAAVDQICQVAQVAGGPPCHLSYCTWVDENDQRMSVI